MTKETERPKNIPMNSLTVGVVFVLGMLFGNWQGDQATIRDCATHGKAKMLGGGAVECEVMKK